jgi:hypothetical protein
MQQPEGAATDNGRKLSQKTPMPLSVSSPGAAAMQVIKAG